VERQSHIGPGWLAAPAIWQSLHGGRDGSEPAMTN